MSFQKDESLVLSVIIVINTCMMERDLCSGASDRKFQLPRDIRQWLTLKVLVSTIDALGHF